MKRTRTRRQARMIANRASNNLHIECPTCRTKLEGGLVEALHHNKLHRHWSVGQ